MFSVTCSGDGLIGPEMWRLGNCGEVWVTGAVKGGAGPGRGCGLGWTGALYFCCSISGILCCCYKQRNTISTRAEIRGLSIVI